MEQKELQQRLYDWWRRFGQDSKIADELKHAFTHMVAVDAEEPHVNLPISWIQRVDYWRDLKLMLYSELRLFDGVTLAKDYHNITSDRDEGRMVRDRAFAYFVFKIARENRW